MISTLRLLLLSAIVSFLIVAGNGSPAWAQQPLNASSKTIVVLIGVKDYNRRLDLRWCDNDVNLVERTLKQYCQCDSVIRMTNQSEKKYQPTRGNIISVLSDRLKMESERGFDRLIIFFAGHGVLDKNQKLYLAPQDCAMTRIQDTAVSVAKIRALLNEHKGFKEKYLFLDACHAGETRSGDAKANGQLIAKELLDVNGLFTLAACRANEFSYEWREQRHGVFTFFFCEALAGAADKSPYGNGNGVVDTKELTDYVSEHVERQADAMNAHQHPIALRSRDWKGPIDFVRLRTARKNPQLQATVRAALGEAWKYRNGPQYRAAIEKLDEALELAPSHPELLALRGQYHSEFAATLAKLESLREAESHRTMAEQDLSRAISTDAGDAPSRLASFYSLRSAVRFRSQEYEKALADASLVLSMQPSATAFLNRSEIYERLKQPELARKDKQAAKKWEESKS